MSDQASVVLVIINVEVVEVVVAMGGRVGVMAEEAVVIKNRWIDAFTWVTITKDHWFKHKNKPRNITFTGNDDNNITTFSAVTQTTNNETSENKHTCNEFGERDKSLRIKVRKRQIVFDVIDQEWWYQAKNSTLQITNRRNINEAAKISIISLIDNLQGHIRCGNCKLDSHVQTSYSG